MRSPSPPTPDQIAAARTFLLAKWRERAAERGEPAPADLSGACKFAAAFVVEVFGGHIEAHDFHSWAIVDGDVVDLCETATDARAMAEGRMPPYLAEYARVWGVGLPDHIHRADRRFMRLSGFGEALEANAPRVKRWADEFRRLQADGISSDGHDRPARSM